MVVVVVVVSAIERGHDDEVAPAAVDGDHVGVAAKGLDVFAHPLHRKALVLQPVVPGAVGLFFPIGLEKCRPKWKKEPFNVV